VTTLNLQEWNQKLQQVQRVVETVNLLSDPNFASEKEVEFGIRIRGPGEKKGEFIDYFSTRLVCIVKFIDYFFTRLVCIVKTNRSSLCLSLICSKKVFKLSHVYWS
jgi:hypothetical protein